MTNFQTLYLNLLLIFKMCLFPPPPAPPPLNNNKQGSNCKIVLQTCPRHRAAIYKNQYTKISNHVNGIGIYIY